MCDRPLIPPFSGWPACGSPIVRKLYPVLAAPPFSNILAKNHHEPAWKHTFTSRQKSTYVKTEILQFKRFRSLRAISVISAWFVHSGVFSLTKILQGLITEVQFRTYQSTADWLRVSIELLFSPNGVSGGLCDRHRPASHVSCSQELPHVTCHDDEINSKHDNKSLTVLTAREAERKAWPQISYIDVGITMEAFHVCVDQWWKITEYCLWAKIRVESLKVHPTSFHQFDVTVYYQW